MKKLFLIACLCFCAKVKAQTGEVRWINKSGYNLQSTLLGDNTTPSSCSSTWSTLLYGIPTTSFSTVYAASASWGGYPGLPVAPPNNFNELVIMEFSMGSVIGAMNFPFCGLPDGTYNVVLNPNGTSINVRIANYPSYIEITFTP